MVRFRSGWPVLFVSVLVVSWGGSVSAAPIGVSGYLEVAAVEFDRWSFDSTIVSSGTVTAVDGASSSTETFAITDSSMLFEFTQVRTDRQYAYVFNDLKVQVLLPEPVLVTLSGSYTVTDTGGGGIVRFETVLRLPGSFEPLHLTKLHSGSTVNESFTLGQIGGDLVDEVEGPLTHILYPGILYDLETFALIDRSDPSDTGSRASGHLRIDFEPVPEPSTAILLAAGLIALAARRRSARAA
jgi:hypothetical protein